MQKFVSALESADSDELAAVVVFATRYRHKIKSDMGWDLLLPALVLRADVMVIAKISSAIKGLQREGKMSAAAGLMVWLHTLRAIDDLELRYLGRTIWRHLSRGFSAVPEVAVEMVGEGSELSGMEGYDRFPEGLFPEPQ